mmetsp:Transcript_20305/g.81123  ORF Transcript_20305/g.81123 Transcript_20305/m.81123 type:complete len:88 (+) Transcript_20305:54-317(+)
MAGVKTRKSNKAAGFARRKPQVKRPLTRTKKHKKAAPSVRNVASLVASGGDSRAGQRTVKRAVAEEAAAAARARDEARAKERMDVSS